MDKKYSRKRRIIGEELDAQETMNELFQEVKKEIQKMYPNSKDHDFEVQSYPLAESNIEPIIINDRLTYILYKDRLVGGVVERRTEFNNAEYIYFKDLSKLEEISKE